MLKKEQEADRDELMFKLGTPGLQLTETERKLPAKMVRGPFGLLLALALYSWFFLELLQYVV